MSGRRMLGVGITAAAVAVVAVQFLLAAGEALGRTRAAACKALAPDPIPASLQNVEAPDFELSDANGKKIPLRSQRGHPVFLNFWATWRPPCTEEMPSLERMAAGLEGSDIRTLAVSVDESWTEVKAFFAQGTKLGVLLDTSKEVPKKYTTEKYPETFFIDAQGRVRHYFINKRDWSKPEVIACLGESAMTAQAPSTQTYYDWFSASYEDHRHAGYHRMIDELELGLIRKYGAGRDVFEAGCGTGLLLKETAAVARSAVGLDLSRGMLGPARARGLKVVQGSVTNVPLPSESFDLVYSMKVLAHIPPISEAMAELSRLLRPGGHLLAEFYNPWSLRYLAKRLGGPARIADGTTDHDVFTRYDTLEQARSYLPAGMNVVGVRGVRVVTPTSKLWAVPGLGRVVERVERLACDLPGLRRLGGFMIVIARKGLAMAELRGDILLCDDERSVREFLAIYLKRVGHKVETVANTTEARATIAAREFDVLITDLRMPDGTGLDVLDASKKLRPETQVIVVTAYATAETAIAAMKAGAYDYLLKPFKVDEVGLVVERALERRTLLRENVTLRAEIQGRYRLDRLLGKSAPMTRLYEMIRKIAPARTSVLLVGESGTGKELAARALHELGPRADRPFVAVNCGAIPESLLESELFGHVKGAFTGATADKEGLFEAARGGTLFLDEVGELPQPMQVKLLRALQERKVKPVGGVSERDVDVRVVAATNRDLETEVERGTFRQDLFYRLNVIQIRMPPLRERREDVPLLVEHFLRKFSAEHGRAVTEVEPAAIAALSAYTFPGNVRELENLIERAVTLSSGSRITAEEFPQLRSGGARGGRGPVEPELPPEGLDLEREVETFERAIILRALERTSGNRTEAARLLGITFRSMRYRLSKLGISGGDEDQPAGASGSSATDPDGEPPLSGA